MKFVGWDIYLIRFATYIAAAISKDMRWFIVAALLTIAYELRNIWDKGESDDKS